MDYNILEIRIERKENRLQRITCLVEISPGDVRAIFATTKFNPGYMTLRPDARITEELLQEVAGTGMQTIDRDEIFPNWKKKYFAIPRNTCKNMVSV